jgi:Methyltransferase domain
MNRLEIIQMLMKQKKRNNYLEIGVFNGHIFFRIRSTFKLAVDPDFRFDQIRKTGKAILNPYNFYNQYFQKTSDDFFSQDAPAVLADKKIDIALVDGMHEYQFALRDVENILNYMDDDGVIIMHDCNPQTKEAASTFAEWKANSFAGIWNGDVWKSVVHLRSLRNDINVFVLDCDHGLGIVTRKKPTQMLPYTQEAINDFTYEDFNANRQKWLNLKPADYFYEYFGLK